MFCDSANRPATLRFIVSGLFGGAARASAQPHVVALRYGVYGYRTGWPAVRQAVLQYTVLYPMRQTRHQRRASPAPAHQSQRRIGMRIPPMSCAFPL